MQMSQPAFGKKKWDLFLSHNWGLNHLNHNKVGQLYCKLREMGITCWFDEVDLKGEMVQSILNGIKNSEYFVVFITKEYGDLASNKMVKEQKGNYVQMELMTAITSHYPTQKIITVVTEITMKNEAQWDGKLTLFKTFKYVDYCNPMRLEKAAKDIARHARVSSLCDFLSRNSPLPPSTLPNQ